MWIGIAAAQNISGERHIVGADSSRPAMKVIITFSAKASNGTPQVSAGRVKARYSISRPAIFQPPPLPRNVWTTQDAQTSTAPPPIALQKWPQLP